MKHIRVECVDLNDVRNKHFVASSIKDLFDNIEAHKIIDFIKETRFYKQSEMMQCGCVLWLTTALADVPFHLHPKLVSDNSVSCMV